AAAEAFAAEFADGVVFVPLAPIVDAELVLPTIAEALGIREAPGEPLLETLAAALRDRELLLLLDNVEQVAEAAPQFAALVARAPRLLLLATSRAPLHLSG